MSTSFNKVIFGIVNPMLLLMAAGVAYWGLLPPEMTAPDEPSRTGRIVGEISPPLIPEFTELALLVDQRLRPPLYDPPPPAPPQAPKVTPPPPLHVDLKLVGTIVEADRNRALLAAPNGQVFIRGVGEVVRSQPGEMVVEKVTATEVVLQLKGSPDQRVTLSIKLEVAQ